MNISPEPSIDERAIRIYILCGNAAYNRGDRGNLLSQIDLLKHSFPNAEIFMDSYRPDLDAPWFGVTVFPRGLFLTCKQIAGLKKADMIVWGGGALLADNSCRLLIPQWLAIIAFVRLILRKPIMVWAQGLVIETKLGALLARFALKLTDTATLRDRNSMETFQKLNPGIACAQTADPAVLLHPAAREVGLAILHKEGIPTDRPLFCISPTFWHFYHDHRSILPYPMGKRFSRTLKRNDESLQRYKHGLATLARLLTDRHDAHVLIMPRYPSPLWNDMRYCHEIASAGDRPGRIHVLQHDNYPPREFFALWRCFTMTISVALHDAIFAAALNTPCLHLYYEPKGKDFFESLEAQNQLMPWNILLEPDGPKRICDTAEAILSGWARTGAAQAGKLAVLQDKARDNVRILQQLCRNTL